jgi:hypothetical protein
VPNLLRPQTSEERSTTMKPVALIVASFATLAIHASAGTPGAVQSSVQGNAPVQLAQEDINNVCGSGPLNFLNCKEIILVPGGGKHCRTVQQTPGAPAAWVLMPPALADRDRYNAIAYHNSGPISDGVLCGFCYRFEEDCR